jgi:hypothetical protein
VARGICLSGLSGDFTPREPRLATISRRDQSLAPNGSDLNRRQTMAKKRKPARKHIVRANLSVLELTKAGTSLDLEIFAAGEKIGTLQIGRGSLSWWGGKRKTAKRLSWSRFAQHMDKLAYGD